MPYDFNPVTNTDVCRKIANILTCPKRNVDAYYPLLYNELKAHGLVDRFEIIVALATIAVESGTFDFVVKERRSNESCVQMYWDNLRVRKNLGNTSPTDAHRYKGRGPLQLTGRYNYNKYGKLIGVDLLANPDAACEPNNAVKIFRAYFQDHGCDVWANRWAGVNEDALKTCRKKVNGGLTHYDRFRKVAMSLLALG